MVKEHWCCGNAETQGNPSTLSGTLLKNCTGQRFSEGICASENYRLDTTLGQCAEAISKRKCIQTVGWSSPAWFQEQRLWTVLIYTHLIPFCKCICLFCVIVMLLLKRVEHVKHIMNASLRVVNDIFKSMRNNHKFVLRVGSNWADSAWLWHLNAETLRVNVIYCVSRQLAPCCTSWPFCASGFRPSVHYSVYASWGCIPTFNFFLSFKIEFEIQHIHNGQQRSD